MADTALRPRGCHRAVVKQDLRRRHLLAGARSRPWADQDRLSLVLRGRWPSMVDPSHPAVAYLYAEDRKAARAAEHLSHFDGALQVDEYAGFKRLAGDRADASIRLAFCWAHMRRDFFQFHASTKSPLAADLLSQVAALYGSRRRYALSPPSSDDGSARSETDQSSRPCMTGCTFMSSVSRVRPIWRKPCVMRSGTGSAWLPSLMMVASRWVESRCGAAAVGRTYLLPPLSSCGLTGSSVAPSPHPARQTGHADFPHPAFSRPVRPSLSAGQRVAVGRYRGRLSRRDTRLGSGETQRFVVPHGASTSGGPAVPCTPERAHTSI